MLEARLGRDEQVDTAGGILLSAAICEDLDFVANVSGCAIGIVIGAGERVLGA